ncbi:VWA domain-containing protein [Jeotgalibacillus sp. R-1-5s-1]|uniref:vWA domain-containing protein n=1 Tax=Jeotgalibacillus sp. R-1-5s-1 TaxID=2555897 RepID=UPI00106C1768|nr:VWA domain-containing protein [Jeotgalibacillus sp. R-1-5s-1]TFD99386.1 VWA domain-containing protein [Jeotgalibacillus sp. R-1-5s-1]
MKKHYWIPAAALCLVLAACQDQEEPLESAQNNEQEQLSENDPEQEVAENEGSVGQDVIGSIESLNLSEPPQSLKELISQQSGPLGNVTLNTSDEDLKNQFLEAFGDIPALPEDATEEELDAYFSLIYQLTAYEFPDPKDISDQLRFALSGTPEADPKFQFKENYNVEIILDASGSMGAYVGDQTRMEQAKEEINRFLASVPEEANVSLRVYGHEGTGDEADKAMSCAAVEEVYERGTYDEGAFQDALNQFEPAGWTPVAGALESSAESFSDLSGEENTNLVYLVSDGIETCDGDPVAAAKTFADSNVSPIINVIGFNADSETQEQLRQVADSAGGLFTNVNNADQLREEFSQTEKILQNWKRWKLDASTDVRNQSNDASFAITRFSNTWGSSAREQWLSFYDANRILREEGKMTLEQQKELEQRADEVKVLAEQSQETLKTELEDLREQGIEELEQRIEELYPDEAE